MIIKEKRGMTFNEIEIGQIVQHLTKRTVTEADNLLFTMLTLKCKITITCFYWRYINGIQ